MSSLKILSESKKEYLIQRARGKTCKQAAMTAGYAESTAECAARTVETPDLKEALEQALQRSASPARLADEFAKGIEAPTPKMMSWADKIRLLQLYAEYAGYAKKDENRSSNLIAINIDSSAQKPSEVLTLTEQSTPLPLPVETEDNAS